MAEAADVLNGKPAESGSVSSLTLTSSLWFGHGEFRLCHAVLEPRSPRPVFYTLIYTSSPLCLD